MLKFASVPKRKNDIFEIDEVKFTVAHLGRCSRELTSVEFRILACFARSPNRSLKKSELLDSIWGGTLVHTKTINVHFSHLRHKLKEIGIDVVHEGKSCFRVLPIREAKDGVEELLASS